MASRYLGVSVDDVSIARTLEGKPAVVGADFEVNLAHSGSIAIVAVASRAVGIDVERRRQVAGRSLPAHTLGPAELACFEVAADPAHVFLDLWTRKEALLKAAGLGLAVDPRTIEINADGDVALAAPRARGASDWTLASISVDGYVATVAMRGTVATLFEYDTRQGSVV